MLEICFSSLRPAMDVAFLPLLFHERGIMSAFCGGHYISLTHLRLIYCLS